MHTALTNPLLESKKPPVLTDFYSKTSLQNVLQWATGREHNMKAQEKALLDSIF